MARSPEMRVLVTGAAGFVGTKVAARLRLDFPQAELILADHGGQAASLRDGVAVDIADAAAVDALVQEWRPTTILHLAAVSAVTNAAADQRNTWRINTMGTLNLAISVVDHAPNCHLVFVSSAEVYGRSAFSGQPVTEVSLLQPANPYAATKAAADQLIQEASGRGLFATILRPFNHTGPGQIDNFAVPSFCRQIAQIEAGQQEAIMLVGELDDQRDFLDVHDVVDLYSRVIGLGQNLENGLVMNVASGRPRRIREVLDTLLSFSSAQISIQVDPARIRPTRVPKIIGDASKARELIGWIPTTRFEDTLLNTLNYWRSKY